jgi:hypothetical protein
MKIAENRLFWLFAAALFSFATVADSAPIAYVGTGQKQFGVIDLATGAFTPRGSTPDVLEGLAFSNGVLYGIDTSGHLLTVNAADGATAIIGATGIPGAGARCGSRTRVVLYFAFVGRFVRLRLCESPLLDQCRDWSRHTDRRNWDSANYNADIEHRRGR